MQVAEHIMAQWDILPSQRDRVWFVGDSKDDMLCGEYSAITPYTRTPIYYTTIILLINCKRATINTTNPSLLPIYTILYP